MPERSPLVLPCSKQLFRLIVRIKNTDAVMTLVFDGNISATRDTNGKQSIIQAQDNPDVGIVIMDSQQNSVDLDAWQHQ